ncbi:MurR/RpiR family transcriptional regulator [Metabacillus arenae]|uniref:MurR/RpiR family transcriptional regulator n=1 Tax=Metabacillus arenae TaxID=2771434 RepID=A0A926NL17_9BACI|nr:MurR/RpiR family transcriptional regulator [Metabacillus arenae]MBD1382695.1 MurR/RpiR family transcriptional regulator [Metabacillus arenae]
METVLKEIQSKYASFSDKERNIADYLLSSPEEASRSHIHEIAALTGVSVATITRFAKKVSCRNFVELKVKLARESKVPEEGQDVDDLLKHQYEEMFSDIQALSGKAALTNVLTMIEAASRVYIYGLGSSGLAAQELNYRLSRMGFTSEAVTDPHLMVIRSTLLNENDLVLAFSRSGQTRDLLKSIKKAKEQNVKLVSITAFGESELAKLSDEVLWTIHPIRTGYLSTGLDMSALFLIDRLSLHFLENPERRKIYDQTVEAITVQTQ